MFSSLVYAVVFSFLLLLLGLLWALFLQLGLKWAKVAEVTKRRVVGAAAIVVAFQVTLNALFFFVELSFEEPSIVFTVVELAGAIILPCIVISAVFKIRLRQAILAWLPTILAPSITLAFAVLAMRPMLYDSFVVSTNAMAPTLLGQHWKGTCAKCGEIGYSSPRNERSGAADSPLMICDNFHVTEALDIDKTVETSDRFMVAKFLVPQRWDLVVFQYPEMPETLYVKRLVGFPGEKIHIHDGAVWVNGERQTPPDSVQGIEYLSDLPVRTGRSLWGTKDRPALLGDDEYFVLGDFSARSTDSRLWQHGAPGHNPFAVPESHLKGVITHTFWPPQRWRIHR